MTFLDLILMFPSSGGAADGKGSGGIFTPTNLVFPLILVVMYFFMIRPQQKKAKEASKFKESIDKGQKVVTIGGLHGKIVEVKEKTYIVETVGGTRLEFEKSAISPEMTRAAQNPAPAPTAK